MGPSDDDDDCVFDTWSVLVVSNVSIIVRISINKVELQVFFCIFIYVLQNITKTVLLHMEHI